MGGTVLATLFTGDIAQPHGESGLALTAVAGALVGWAYTGARRVH